MLKILLFTVIIIIGQLICCQDTPKPISAPSPQGNYRSGKLSFEGDRNSSSVNFTSMDSPLLMLSISHIEYNGLISLKVNRTLDNTS
jgi:hypothetical protein